MYPRKTGYKVEGKSRRIAQEKCSGDFLDRVRRSVEDKRRRVEAAAGCAASAEETFAPVISQYARACRPAPRSLHDLSIGDVERSKAHRVRSDKPLSLPPQLNLPQPCHKAEPYPNPNTKLEPTLTLALSSAPTLAPLACQLGRLRVRVRAMVWARVIPNLDPL